jgi:hypothetical protein
MIVPRLPGSRTSSRMTTSCGSPAKMSLIEVGNCCATAMNPCGVTVSAIDSSTCSVTNSISRPAADAAAAISVYRSSAVGVEYSSRIRSGRNCRASDTACGPSRRNRPVSCLAGRLASLATDRTRGDRGLSSTHPS